MTFHIIEGGVTAAKGFQASGIHCGIRKNRSKADLALIYSDVPCAAAAVYTQNLVKGDPIAVTKRNIADGMARAVICNSGNANTCNADGEEKAQKMCDLIAAELHIDASDVIVASTGVIGQVLPIEPIANSVKTLAEALSATGSNDAAKAIMTTDTVEKEYALEVELDGKTVTIGGITKGSGMIHPNMATMLGFLSTDASITPELLNEALHTAIEDTFNMVSVDGDTSTNDMVSVMASGLAENQTITEKNHDYELFTQALTEVCAVLSRKIAKDGEGATRLLECAVTGAKTKEDARTVAKSVICSNLLKCAIFGADANWGRVLCAIGYSGANININGVDVAFESKQGRIEVCKNGAGLPFDEDIAKKILLEDDIIVAVTLHEGSECATAYGCDLTYDYVKINGDYRS